MYATAITKDQRAALKRVFDRQALILTYGKTGELNMPARAENYAPGFAPVMTYRQFRKLAFVSFGALMVPWCGMWLGIESDGYTHS